MYTITIQSEIYAKDTVYKIEDSAEAYKDYYKTVSDMAKLTAMLSGMSFTIKMECDVLGLVERFEGKSFKYKFGK